MSRVLSKVGPNDKLACSVCLTDHPTYEFGINASSDRQACYYSFCKRAQRMRSRLATWYKDANGTRRRRYPDHAAVRAALGRPAAPPRPKLKSAGHKRPQRRPDSDPRLVEARAHRAKAARLEREASKEREGYVYLVIEVKPGGGLDYGKIGHTTDLDRRIGELQQGNHRRLSMLYARPGTEDDEKSLHRKYINDNKLGEWFKITKDLLLEWDTAHYIYAHPKEGVA